MKFGSSIIHSMVHILVFTGPLNSLWMGRYDQCYRKFSGKSVRHGIWPILLVKVSVLQNL